MLISKYGVPNVVVSGNGPQFSSADFADFAQTWGFTHTTTSPYYPQSNGKAENAVKTIKRLFTKCRESGQSEYRALLDWRNTPTEGMGTSPAQRFLGRRCRTLLPITESLLNPRYPVKQDVKELQAQKQRHYNKHSKDLKPINPGESVRMRLPGQTTWTLGTCTAVVGPRSYEIKIGNTTYRRNRRHLIRSSESGSAENVKWDLEQQTETPDEGDSTSTAEQTETSTAPGTDGTQEAPSVRRSQRHHQSPRWMEDYVPL